MYVLGRYGTYFIELQYIEKEDRVVIRSAQYAKEGFNKHFD